MTGFTPYHSQVHLAHRLTLEGATDDVFAKSLSTARMDLNPHQVDAALFALGSPVSKGVGSRLEAISHLCCLHQRRHQTRARRGRTRLHAVSSATASRSHRRWRRRRSWLAWFLVQTSR